MTVRSRQCPNKFAFGSRPLVRISIVTCWLSDISAIVLFIHLYLALILVRLSLGIAIILWC